MKEEEEEWFEIPEYPNYKINKKGQIINSRGKILKPVNHSEGYLQIGLHKNGKVKIFKIHRLMAMVFMPKLYTNSKLVINHKDLNKKNNNLENLELITQKENILHSKINGRQERKKGIKNKLSKKVYQYTKEYEFIREWDCVMQIKRELHIKSSNISNCALHKSKTAKGYIWSYKKIERRK